MPIRKTQSKFLLLMGLVIGISVLCLLFLRQAVDKQANLLLEDKTREKKSLLSRMIELNGEPTRTLAHDYSMWDDMVTFVKTGDSSWADINIVASLTTFRTDGAWVFSPRFAPVYKTALTESSFLMTDTILENALTQVIRRQGFNHFFWMGSDGLLEIRTAPVQPSDDIDRKTTPQGFFVIAKRWDQDYLTTLEQSIRSTVSLRTLPSGPSGVKDGLKEASPGTVQFSQTLPGPDGTPVAVVLCSSETPLYGLFLDSAHYQLICIAAFCFTLMFVLFLAIRTWVSRPLRQVMLSLQSGTPVPPDRMKGTGIEFSRIAELLSAFLTQKEMLEVEVNDRKRSEEALRLNSERVQVLLKLNQMIDATEQEITDYALEEGVRLTRSKIGYLAFVNEDETIFTMHSWSGQATQECAVIDKSILYPVKDAGLWGEAVRQRRAVITNNYAAPNPQKKENPTGHATVRRHMNVPVFIGRHIVLVAGVENKDDDYNEDDVQQLTLLMEGMWRLIERKRAEEEVQKLAFVVRYSSELVNLSTPDGRMIFLNEAGMRMLGIAPKEVEQANIMRVIPDHLKAKVEHELLPAVLSGGVWEGELQYRNLRTGELTDVHTVIFAIMDKSGSSPLYLANVSLDITERKRIEEILRQSEDKYRSIVETTSDWIWEMDLTGTHTFSNAAVMSMLGYRPEELVGRSAVHLMHAEDSLEVQTQLPRLIADKRGWEGWVLRWRHKDGSYRFLESNANPIIDATGALVGYRGADRDITERKQAEVQRRLLENKLEKAQRMESLAVLAGGVAHDLNNMLGPVVGYSELLLRTMPMDSNDAGRVQKIMKSAQDAADIVQDLLTLARRGRYEMKSLSLNQVVLSFLESTGFCKLKELHSGVEVKTRLAENLGTINGSRPHLEKALMNLVGNACEAMPAGGTLTIETEGRYLEGLLGGTVAIGKGQYTLLRVRDTGHGIDSGDLPRIFEPYFSKKQMGHSGSGLGLSVVYGVVKDHCGYYDVFSELGKGTEFILYFPTGDILPENTIEAVQAFSGGTESILIVDDSPEQREMAKEIIESLGYSVLTAENGHKGVELLRNQSPPDLIVLDMIMEPGFDGLDTYREILRICPNQKAIVVSGFSATERVQAVLDLGATAFVRKPFTVDTIARALRSTLDSPTTTCSDRKDRAFQKA